MPFDDLFNSETELMKMSQKEFIEQAKKIFSNIQRDYHQAWQSRPLEDSEFPNEDICAKCTGCGTFKFGDENLECFQDKEQGWCYHRFADYEGLGIELETHIEDIGSLMAAEEITP